MRILHTSDWHLGRSFHRVGMLDAQAAFVDHLVDVVRTEAVDAIIVAGDVYDRALPGVDVVTLLDDALWRLSDTGAAVILSSGNHDSARRLGFGSRLLSRAGVYVRTDPGGVGSPVLLEDRHGPVAIYPLPYLEPALTADVLGVERSHRGVLGAAMAAVRSDLAGRPAGTRSVVAAHAFVGGALTSESERDISVGGLSAVPVSTFSGVDYVALGHLHGRQRLAETVRYSGSPLPYSFSEAGHVKGSWLIDLDADGVKEIDAVPAPVHRPLAVLRGALADLLADPRYRTQERSFCQVTLTDAVRPREPMARLRERFPHTLALAFEPQGRGETASTYSERVHGRDDVELCCGFLDHVRQRDPEPAERDLVRQAVEAVRIGATENAR